MGITESEQASDFSLCVFTLVSSSKHHYCQSILYMSLGNNNKKRRGSETNLKKHNNENKCVGMRTINWGVQ